LSPGDAMAAWSGGTGQAGLLLKDAIVALQGNRPGEAERLAASVLTIDPGNAVAAQILGNALLLQNRTAEAIVKLERLASGREDPVLELLLASALAAEGRSEAALEQLRRAAARQPPYAPAFAALARPLAAAGELAEAIAILKDGLMAFPGDLELAVELAGISGRRNDRARARKLLAGALAAAPQNLLLCFHLAVLTQLDGEYAAAAELYRRALVMQSDEAMRKNLGACLLEMGQREAGEASIRAAVAAAPSLAGKAIQVLAEASHGRLFLRENAARKFLQQSPG
jgi:predicted Zn-dependent protease